jgi:superfamily II DNA or RNA helicase
VQHWRKYANNLKTIVFAINCDHSRAIAQAYINEGISAAHIDGETDIETRKAVIKAFGSGDITVLSNVGLFTEGFDMPSIGCVQLARPTKSVSLYYQAVGRALRPSEGKTEAIILDHTGVYHEHGSVTEYRKWELTESKPVVSKEPREFINIERGERVFKHLTDAELVAAETLTPGWITLLGDLIQAQEAQGHKKMWVVHRFLDFYPEPNQAQFEAIGKALDYHWRWASNFVEKRNAAANAAVSV